ncbi:PAS domain-containing protein [bacterium]|nr:PAS domain-containing protein [bacterium]
MLEKKSNVYFQTLQLSLAVFSIFFIISIILKFTLLIKVTGFALAGLCFSYVLDDFNFHKSSKWVTIISVLTGLSFIAIVLGKDCGFHLFLIVFAFYPLLVFRPNQIRSIAITVMFTVIGFFLVERFGANGSMVRGISSQFSDMIYQFSVISVFLNLFFGLYFLNIVQQRKQIILDKQNKQLKKIARELKNYKYAVDRLASVAITDGDGVIEHVNDKFSTHSKYDKDELVGSTHQLINSGHHSKDFIKTMWKTIGNGDVWSGDVKNKAKDGSFYWVNMFIVPFKNEDKNSFRYLAIRFLKSDSSQT